MRKKSFKFTVMGGLIFFSLLSSCMIDRGYDLDKDIDLSITVGGEELSIPIGNTEKLFLKKFIKVEESGLLDTLVTGEYFLNKAGLIDDMVVAPVNEMEIEAMKFNIPMINISPENPIFSRAMFVIVHVDDKASFKLEFNRVSQGIVGVSSCDIKDTDIREVTISISAEYLGASEWIELSELSLLFPNFIVFEEGQEGLDCDSNIFSFSKNNNAILSDANRNYTIKLKIKGIEFEKIKQVKSDELNPEIRTLLIDGDISMKGSFKILMDNFSNNRNLFLNLNIGIDKLFISSIIGNLKPDIKVKPAVIEIDDLPEFLRDEEVRMDLTNTEIIFIIDNPLGFPLLINAEMWGIKGNKKTHEEAVKSGSFTVPADKKTTVVLSESGGNNEADVMNIKVENLNELFTVIPDSIKLDINAEAASGDNNKMNLGRTETVKSDYKVNIPLTFGKNLVIIYKDTINGFNKDIKNLEIKQVNIEAQAENSIPLELYLTGYAIDVDGRELEGITVQIKDNQVISPCKADDSPDFTSLVIEIRKSVNAGDIAMKDVDGIVLRVKANTAEAIENKPLKSYQYLLLKDIRMKIPGGIKIDLN